MENNVVKYAMITRKKERNNNIMYVFRGKWKRLTKTTTTILHVRKIKKKENEIKTVITRG